MTDPLEEMAREIVDWLRRNMDITSPTSCWETEDKLQVKIVDALNALRSKTRKEDAEIALAHIEMIRGVQQQGQIRERTKQQIAQAILKKEEEEHG